MVFLYFYLHFLYSWWIGKTEDDLLEMDPIATYRIMVDSRGRKIIVKEVPIPASENSSEFGANSRPEDGHNSGVITFGTTGDALDIEEKVIEP